MTILCSSWGKHKHRRFVKGLDPGSTASEFQKGDDPDSPAPEFQTQSLPIASSTAVDLPLNPTSEFQTQTLPIASSIATTNLPRNLASEFQAQTLPIDSSTFQTQPLPIVSSTTTDLVKDGTTPLKLDENNRSRRSKRIPVKSPRKERTVLSLMVPISKREIEKDLWKMIGKKPPTRPKKRPRVVQQQLDTLFPGLCLAKVLTDQYDVPEPPPCNRKINGLRGLMEEGYDWDEI